MDVRYVTICFWIFSEKGSLVYFLDYLDSLLLNAWKYVIQIFCSLFSKTSHGFQLRLQFDWLNINCSPFLFDTIVLPWLVQDDMVIFYSPHFLIDSKYL